LEKIDHFDEIDRECFKRNEANFLKKICLWNLKSDVLILDLPCNKWGYN